MKRILLIAMLVMLPMTAHAANHYIRSAASGSANGNDWTNAWTDLPSTFVRGDTYYVAGGSYGGHEFTTASSGTTLITIKKATVADHGTATGWSDAYGTAQAVFNGQIWFEASYIVFDGVTGGGPGQWTSGFGFKIIDAVDTEALIKIGDTGNGTAGYVVTVRHIEEQGKGSAGGGGSAGNDGVAIFSSGAITMSYYYMHGIGRCPIFGYSQGVDLFEYGYIGDYYGSGTGHSEVASLGQNQLADFTFRNSIVAWVASTGGLMWNTMNNANAHMYVYGNVFYLPSGHSYDQANGMIGGWSGGNGETFRNCWVYNNTFINVYLPLSNFPNTFSGNIAENNIFYNCTSVNTSRFSTHDYNTYINSGGSQGEAHETVASSGNPFTDYVNLDFSLTAATVAGLTLSSPTGITVDPLANTRGADGTWDRGAYEFLAGGSPPTTYTVTPSAGSHGNVSPNTLQVVSSGAVVALTTIPDNGYLFSSFTLTGGCTGPISYGGNNYGIGPITGNCSIVASYSLAPAATGVGDMGTGGNLGSLGFGNNISVFQ